MSFTVEGLNLKDFYDNYGRTSDKEIREYLSKIMIVREEDDKFYHYKDSFLSKMKHEPRSTSMMSAETTFEKLSKFDIWKRVTYLCKSSSRFFLKVDIGEIFDQIDRNDIPKIKAIAYCIDYAEIEGTDGEHFLLTAILLWNSRERKLERICK